MGLLHFYGDFWYKENAMTSFIDKFKNLKDREEECRTKCTGINWYELGREFYKNHPIEGCIKSPNDYGSRDIDNINKFLNENEPRIDPSANGSIMAEINYHNFTHNIW